MFDHCPPFCSYSWEHVFCFSQRERECVVGESQYAGLEERRAQGGGLHFTQRSVERVPILWEEEAPCLFPTHRPLFSTNTLLRSTFSLVRTLWRAFNLLMTTMNNWKLLRSVWKLRCVSFEMEVTPGHHFQTKSNLKEWFKILPCRLYPQRGGGSTPHFCDLFWAEKQVVVWPKTLPLTFWSNCNPFFGPFFLYKNTIFIRFWWNFLGVKVKDLPKGGEGYPQFLQPLFGNLGEGIYPLQKNFA